MKLTFGEIPKQRTKRTLKALLTFVNEEYGHLNFCCHKDMEVFKSGSNQLTIKATLKQLIDLVDDYEHKYEGSERNATKAWCLEEVLEHFRVTLNIYTDIRQKTKGSKYRIFRLDLWNVVEDELRNLEQFDRAWDKYKNLRDFKVTNPPQGGSQAPFQLTTETQIFVGREEELKILKENLISDSQALKFIGVYGMGGVGKSTLAKFFALTSRNLFPDGVLFADLRTQEPAYILESLAGAYGIELDSIKNLDNKADFVRRLLSKKRSLLILDNANNAKILSYLLPSQGHCAVIVTARDRDIIPIQEFKKIILEPLSEKESTELLTNLLSFDNDKSRRDEIANITNLCGNLPLAINIAGSLIKYSSCKLDDYIKSLETEKKKLNVLEWRSLSVRLSFNITWDSLDYRLKSLFSSLSIFEGSVFELFELAAALGEAPIKAQIEMANLVAVSLVSVNGSKQYKLHPLLKEFASEKVAQMNFDEVSILYKRLAIFYIDLIKESKITYNQINDNYGNLIGILQWTIQNGLKEESILFSQVIGNFLLLKGYWNDGCNILNETILACQSLKDVQNEHELKLKLSELLREQGNYNQAEEQYEICKNYFELTSQKDKLAGVIREIGELNRVRRNYLKARELHIISCSLYIDIKCKQGEGQSLHDLGLIERILGNYEKSKEFLESSLQIRDQLNDSCGKAYNLLELGIVYRLQRNSLSKELINKSLADFEMLGDKRGQAYALRELGELAITENDYINAEIFHKKA